MRIWFTALALVALPVFAAPEPNDTAKIEKTVLSECYVDSAFDESAILEKAVFAGTGVKWIYATYRHSYLVKRRILIVGLSSSGQIYEREVESSEPLHQDFSRRADYHEMHEANNFDTQRARLGVQVRDYLRAREPFQCK